MSDYTKGTNFAAKDTLLSGDANKIVSGTEIDDEYNLVRTAVNSKADATSGTLTTPDINNPDIDGGTIDSTAINGGTIGASTPVLSLNVDNIDIDGNTISSTDTDGNIVLTPNGSGVVDINVADIDGGNIDNTPIGASTPSTVVATTATATDVVVDTNVLVVDGTTNNNVGIGTATPDSAYKLDVSGDVRATNFIGNASSLTGIKTGYSWIDAGTASGTEEDLTIDTTNISQIIILASGVKGSGDTANDAWHLRVGTSGGVVDTGYHGGFTANNSADSGGTDSAWKLIERYGSGSETTFIIKLFNPVGNEWFMESNAYQDSTGTPGYNDDQFGAVAAGHISLGGALTTVRFMPFGGSFTAGEIYYGTKVD
jgi:hypothetical protein